MIVLSIVMRCDDNMIERYIERDVYCFAAQIQARQQTAETAQINI